MFLLHWFGSLLPLCSAWWFAIQ